ncbi:hypothetical protein E4U41_007052 [Claviceps citrina]|nr:hypothetical protein E4U41_007052 [Claviceps citrina]
MASTAASRVTTDGAWTAEYLAQSQSEVVKGVAWTVTGLPLVLVFLRCYTRLWLRSVFGLDDCIMVAAMVRCPGYFSCPAQECTPVRNTVLDNWAQLLSIAYAAILTAAADRGLGRHVEHVRQNPQNVVDVALLGFASQPLVIMSCALGKTSFALTLIRVAAQRWVNGLLWFIIISLNALHLMLCLFVFLRCEDPRHLWNPAAIPSRCWSAPVFDGISLFIGSYSAATDFALALLPWAILWKLQMKKREKLGVAAAMSLGILAGSVAIVKIQHLAANSDDKDITYSIASLLWWAGIENGLILLGACVPTLWPLFKKVFPGSTARKEPAPSNCHQLTRRGQRSTTVETKVPSNHLSDERTEEQGPDQRFADAVRKEEHIESFGSSHYHEDGG